MKIYTTNLLCICIGIAFLGAGLFQIITRKPFALNPKKYTEAEVKLLLYPTGIAASIGGIFLIVFSLALMRALPFVAGFIGAIGTAISFIILNLMIKRVKGKIR